MKRKMKRAIIYTSLVAVILFVILASVSVYTYVKHPELASENRIVEYVFTKKVEKHRETVEMYADEAGVSEYTNLLLAMMLQESGGQGNDPMQSSESLCGSVGCIDSADQSIEQGVKYFASALEKAEGDVHLAVQSYNFGLGFIEYVQDHDTAFNQDIVTQFSQEMYQAVEVKEHYQCLRQEAVALDACYGDIFYTRDVMDHQKNFEQ